MLRQTRWLVAALAAALWVVPAAAQTSSSDQQKTPSQTSQGSTATSPSDLPRAEPGKGGAGNDAQSAAQAGGQQQETMGTGSTSAGSTGREPKGTSDATAPGATGATGGSQTSGTGRGGSSYDAKSAQTQAPGAATGEKKDSSSEKSHSMGHASMADAHTLAKMHMGNQHEIEAGTWMQEHASNDKVKDFAKKMVDDHGKMDKDLTSFAQKNSIDLTAPEHGAHAAEHSKDAKTLEDLKGMQGAQADRAYMKMMVDDHTKDVKETKAAAQRAKQAKSDELAKMLEKSAKKMEDHLKDAQKIQREISQRQARTPSAQ